MTPVRKIALAGASGNLGPTILRELLANRFQVLLLTRKGSNSANIFKNIENVIIAEVNYQNVQALANVLQGSEVVVSTISNAGLDLQLRLIDAAVSAGVKRFIPSEFGADPEQERNKTLPFYLKKLRTLDYLKRKVAEVPDFSYTRITTHAFFDWGIQAGFLADPVEHKITIYNDGNTPFSVTNLSTIAKAVTGVIKRLEPFANRELLIHDAAITQNQLVRLAEEADGIKWTITKADTN